MPIYEYRCQSCGNVVEVIQKMSDAPLSTCDSCSGPLEKLVSRAAFQLAGGGWSSSGYTKSAGSGDASASSESSGDKADSKPKGGCGSGCGCH